MAVEGDTAVVGAPSADGTRGAVYVFTRSGSDWAQTAKLTASDGAAGDELGASVAIDGDTIVAGAPRTEDNRGVVYTFTTTGAPGRQQTGKLTLHNALSGDNLGSSVAIDGDTIVAGALSEAVYTFARGGASTRHETARLAASDRAWGDRFGSSVAIDGDTIVVGAHWDDIGAVDDMGSVYTFARTGSTSRQETAKLTASSTEGSAGDSLGSSVAIDGDTILAGAYGDDADLYQPDGTPIRRRG